MILRQKSANRLRHAIPASQIAGVGYRDAKRVMTPAESVD